MAHNEIMPNRIESHRKTTMLQPQDTPRNARLEARVCEAIRLSRQEQIAFASALLAPPKPGARLQKAVRRYRQKPGR
jgi:hypothetical protein